MVEGELDFTHYCEAETGVILDFVRGL
jgi:hypothetical protein